MKTRHPLFEVIAIILSVLIALQTLPLVAVAKSRLSDTLSETKLAPENSSSAKASKAAADDELFASADALDEQEGGKKGYSGVDIVSEEQDLREQSVKHFRLADGRYMAAVYAEPVHYFEDGEWKEIDNSLKEVKTEEGEDVFVTASTDRPVSFPDRLSEDKDISLSCRGFELDFHAVTDGEVSAKLADPQNLTLAFAEEKVQEKVSEKLSGSAKTNKEDVVIEAGAETEISVDNHDSAVVYANAVNGADLEYKVSSSQVKESIVVKEQQETYDYSFFFRADGLEVFENGDGSISLLENGDEEHPVFVFAAPYMMDAAGETSEAVKMTVSPEEDGSYRLDIHADESWLNEDGRTFPVIIDPTVLLDVGASNISDTYVDTASAYHHAYSQQLYVGQNSLGTTRTFVKFTLPDLPDCSVVVNSKLYLAQSDYDPGSGTTSYMAAYSPSSSWTATSLLWSNQPGYDTSLGAVDYTTFTSGTGSFNYSLDITKIAKVWYETGVNNGVMLKAYDESVTRRAAFYSTNFTYADMYPQITLTYVNSIGLEDYWNYETVDLGRSGTVYVNDYNGALTYVHNDLSMSGNTMPADFSHIYLSDAATLNAFDNTSDLRFGAGFRLSTCEKVQPLSQTDDAELWEAGYRAIYTDADGTEHYFKTTETTNEFAYEFDENVIFTVAPSGADYDFMIRYEDGSKRLYNEYGYFMGLVDQNDNRLNVSLLNNDQMTITDGAGRVTTLNYDSNGYLTSFSDPAGRVTSYTYTGDKLTRITYPDGKYTQYSYDSTTGLLTGILATDGTSVSIAYKAVTCRNKTFYRVQTLTRNGTESAYNSLSFQYDGDQTTVSDQNGTVNKIGFDVFGRAVTVMDQDGNLVTSKYSNGGNQQNKVTSNSNSFSATDNLLYNHSFESGSSNWNVYYALDGYSGAADTSEKKAGTQSFKLTRTSYGGVYLNQDFTDLTAGETYTFSGYMKIDGTINGFGGVKIEVKSGDTILSTEYSLEYSTTNDTWQRVQATVTIPQGADKIRLYAWLESYEAAAAWFDCMQLERDDAAGPYNYLQNPGMELPDGNNDIADWTGTSGVSAVGDIDHVSVKITGDPSANRNVSQTVNISGDEGAVLVFGGTAKGSCSAQCNDTATNSRRFGLKLYLYNGSTLVTSKSLWYNVNAINVTQGISGSIKATGSFNKVVFRLLYNKEVNYATFDDLYLYADNYGSSYTYDSEGKLLLQKSDSGDAIRYTYNGPDITKIAFEKNGTEKDNETYTYDGNHNFLTSTTKDGIKTSYTYPSPNRGMPSRITVENADGSLSSQVSYTYTSYDNYLSSTTDENGEVTTYSYNTTKGLLDSVTDPTGKTTSYTYDSNNDVPLTTAGQIDANNSATVIYGYDSQGRVTSISPAGTTYNFTYDQFGRTVGTAVSGHTLSTVSYNADGTIGSSTYGNGTVHSYTYDSMDRVETESYDNSMAFRYAYNSQGELGILEDVDNSTLWYYEYDLAGRLTGEDSSGGQSTRYTYNDQNNTASYAVTLDGTNVSAANYTYSDVGLLTGVTTNNAAPDFTYSYDGLDRITKESHTVGNNTVSTNYTYETSSVGQTGRISSVTYGSLRNGLSYSYDANGKITSITDGSQTTSYVYDGLGRLVRENSQQQNKTIVYSYDANGNILSKTEYPYSTGTLGTATRTIPYTYDSTWGDQLLTYDGGSTITYDEIGNPLSYRGFTFTWQRGRQLATVQGNGANLSFQYNADGLRVSKTSGSTTTDFSYASGLLVSQTDGTNTLHFTYDPDGVALGINYNGTDYYYLYNAQGDVIGLYNGSGALVVNYSYDSWGKLLSTTGSLASTLGVANPLRYRGYYYDTETNLYLLESRYYDPETGRFVNGDDTISSDSIMARINLYSYCGNDSISRDDNNGHIWRSVIKKFVKHIIKGIQLFKKLKKKQPVPQKTITKSFNKTLRTNARKMASYRKNNNYNFLRTTAQFYKLVRNKGEWDLKQQAKYQGTFLYDDIVVEGQDLGNIHYGYMGKAAGIPDTVLLFAAGFAQMQAGTSKSWYVFFSHGDDPRDQLFILYGIKLYEEQQIERQN